MARSASLRALLILGACAAACSADGGGETAAGEPGRLVRFEEVLASSSSCHGTERAAEALRDPASFSQWWDRATCEGRPVPDLDFSSEMVLGAFGNQGPTGCYAVRIAEVRTGVGGGYQVIVHRHVPASSTPCPMVVVHPAHGVRVPRVRGPVDFTWRTVTGPVPAEESE